MSRHLDRRQRAMLAEMGIPLWAPPAARGQAVPAAPGVATARHGDAPAAPPPVAPVERAAVPPAPAVPAQPVREPQSGRSPLPADVGTMDWAALEASVAACRACGLCEGRQQTVFGIGDREADWMVVGEAPGRNEDRTGEPFVGQAGKLLDHMLAAIGLSRRAAAQTHVQAGGRQLQGVYIANVVKCRPPGNRNPMPEEIATCEPYLKRQIALVQPRILLAMGRFAVQSLLGSSEPVGRLRGRVHRYEGVPLVVTYHPAYLLRSPAAKGKAWQDLCLALSVATGQAGDAERLAAGDGP